MLAASVATLYLVSTQEGARLGFGQFVLLLAAVLGTVVTVIAIDAGTRRKRLSAVGGLFLGLVAGLVAAYALSIVVELAGLYLEPQQLATESDEDYAERIKAFARILEGIKVLIGIITCYVGISLVMQTKDDFRFVIPYVEFAKQVRGNRPVLMDTSVLIDGRVLDVLQTHVLQGTIIVPRFVIDELQTLSDSSDALKRARGRRGLDVVKSLQEQPASEVVLDDRDVEGLGVDQKLVTLAAELSARLMTNDFNLNKVAQLRGVSVINMNDLAKAMRPVVLPGERLAVRIVKPGEGPAQGVGYLDDGTMVVVDQARDSVNQDIELEVTSTLQTSAGRMIFGRIVWPDTSTVVARSSTPQATAPQEDHQPAAASDSESSRVVSPPESSQVNAGNARRGRSGRNPRRT